MVSSAKDVTVLRAALASAVADAHAYTSAARTATTAVQGATTEQTASMTLTAASEAARNATTGFMDDYYKRRIFDSYLTFASAQDEEEYRHREAERQQAIERARAENSPEGNLRAVQLSIDQLHDAGAHGATRSPAYKKWEDDLYAKRDSLQGAIAGRTEEKTARAASTAVDAAKPVAVVSPELLAGIRANGITLADQDGTGPGVAARDTSASGRAAALPPR